MQLDLLKTSEELGRIEAIWRQLTSGSNIPYFHSWGWIHNWIDSLGEDHQVWLAVISEGGTPCVAFFMGQAMVVRKNILKSRGLFLNATGIPLYDSLCTEYNAMTYSNPLRCPFKEILDHLPNPWDEFFMPALDAQSFPGNCLGEPIPPYRIIIDGQDKSDYVDLELVRQKENGYLALLSSNTRAQIRRSYRALESEEPVTTEVAVNAESGLNIYEEMVDLHQKRWRAKKETGAFATKYFYDFHKELIRKRMGHGEIQLLRIKCGNLTIGCLYNFVFQRRIYFYQSGMNYEIAQELRPGLICHVEAIKLNTGLGHMIYDFLAGSERYKSSLSTNSRTLIWAKVRKPSTKFWLEDKGRTVKRAILGCLGKGPRP